MHGRHHSLVSASTAYPELTSEKDQYLSKVGRASKDVFYEYKRGQGHKMRKNQASSTLDGSTKTGSTLLESKPFHDTSPVKVDSYKEFQRQKKKIHVFQRDASRHDSKNYTRSDSTRQKRKRPSTGGPKSGSLPGHTSIFELINHRKPMKSNDDPNTLRILTDNSDLLNHESFLTTGKKEPSQVFFHQSSTARSPNLASGGHSSGRTTAKNRDFSSTLKKTQQESNFLLHAATSTRKRVFSASVTNRKAESQFIPNGAMSKKHVDAVANALSVKTQLPSEENFALVPRGKSQSVRGSRRMGLPRPMTANKSLKGAVTQETTPRMSVSTAAGTGTLKTERSSMTSLRRPSTALSRRSGSRISNEEEEMRHDSASHFILMGDKNFNKPKSKQGSMRASTKSSASASAISSRRQSVHVQHLHKGETFLTEPQNLEQYLDSSDEDDENQTIRADFSALEQEKKNNYEGNDAYAGRTTTKKKEEFDPKKYLEWQPKAFYAVIDKKVGVISNKFMNKRTYFNRDEYVFNRRVDMFQRQQRAKSAQIGRNHTVLSLSSNGAKSNRGMAIMMEADEFCDRISSIVEREHRDTSHFNSAFKMKHGDLAAPSATTEKMIAEAKYTEIFGDDERAEVVREYRQSQHGLFVPNPHAKTKKPGIGGILKK